MAQIYFASSSLKYANEEINLHPFADAQTKMEDERERGRKEGARDLQSAASHDKSLYSDAGLAWLTAHVWGINSTSIFKASESNAPELAAESKD